MPTRIKPVDVMNAAKTQARTVNASLALVVLYFFAQSYNHFLGLVEGSLFPVVSDVKIETASPDIDGVIINGIGRKSRDCAFVAVNWYLVDDHQRIPAQIRYLEGSKIRKPGQFNFGPWLINMTPDQLRHHSVAEVEHRCHSLFNTVSRFFPAG